MFEIFEIFDDDDDDAQIDWKLNYAWQDLAETTVESCLCIKNLTGSRRKNIFDTFDDDNDDDDGGGDDVDDDDDCCS